jgi:DNA-binding response OmpR family regulator
MVKRGLIVDDETIVCEMLGKILASTGIEPVTVTRSADAPTLFNQEKFDVALLDLQMGSPNGMELARQMRLSVWNRKTPIVLISDDQANSALTLGFEAGANFFLYKPVDKGRLLKLLRATQGLEEYEKRRNRRVPLQSKARLRFRSEDFEAETVNVSLSGVLVRAARTLPIGSQVSVTLNLSERTKAIVGGGSVVRARDGQMGIQLDRITFPEIERLQEFLRPLLPDEG